ncbi:hypothetical protein C8R47DRAFT_1230777 [Mycena vitilis]|nr:hypothetical protein C8R47DRAFT_1230777 [Mycena vitilis]
MPPALDVQHIVLWPLVQIAATLPSCELLSAAAARRSRPLPRADESAAQRSPPPPFPPALDLDHDGQDQEPKEAPSHLDTERDVSATPPRPQDALLNRPVPMAGVRGLEAAPSAPAADEDSTVRGVFPGGARASVSEMEEDERMEEDEQMEEDERMEEVIVETDEEVMDVHTEDDVDVDGGETARAAEAIEDQEMQDAAPEAMDLYAQDDNHDSDGSVTDNSDSAEALIRALDRRKYDLDNIQSGYDLMLQTQGAANPRPPLPKLTLRRRTTPAVSRDKTPLFLPSPSPSRAPIRPPSPEAPPEADFFEDEDLREEDFDPVPGDVGVFFDLSALDADSDEEEDEETPADRAFINDYDDDEPPRVGSPNDGDDLSDDSDAEAHAMASDVVRRHRELHNHRRRGDFEHADVEADCPAALRQAAVVPCINDPELYSVVVPRGRELGVVSWVLEIVPRQATTEYLGDLVSAFYRPGESGRVYIETKRRHSLEKAIRNQVGVYVERLIPIDERAALLNDYNPAHHVGWARLKSSTSHLGEYDGDLALIYRDRRALVVPRLPENDPVASERLLRAKSHTAKQEAKPSPRLFGTGHNVRGRLVDRNGLAVENNQTHHHEGRRYLGGLLHLRISDEQVNQRFHPFHCPPPSQAEIDLFRPVTIREVGLPDHTFPALAISEGDRVVTGRPLVGTVGTNGAKFTVDIGTPLFVLATAMVGERRFAAVAQHFYGTQRLAEKHVAGYTPVVNLQHHILRVPRVLQQYDRVRVVAGLCVDEQMGRVIDIDETHGTVTFAPIQPPPGKDGKVSDEGLEPVTRCMCDLEMCFQAGDWVEVTRGPRRGEGAFIVCLRPGGVAELYDPWVKYFDNRSGEMLEDQRGAMIRDRHLVDDPRFSSAELDRCWAEPTHNLKFSNPVDRINAAQNEAKGAPTAPPPREQSDNLREVATQMAKHDVDFRKATDRAMYTGRPFEGRQVKIVGAGKHGEKYDRKKAFVGNNYKGRRGTVRGAVLGLAKGPNKNSKNWESSEWNVQRYLRGNLSIWKDATVMVDIDFSGQCVPVDIHHLEDERTGAPLLHTAAMRVPWKDIPDRPRTPDALPIPGTPHGASHYRMAAGEASDLGNGAWDIHAPNPTLTPEERRADDARKSQLNGTWICDHRLVGKRIDVVIDASTVVPWAEKKNAKDLNSGRATGRCGYTIIPEKFKPTSDKAHVKWGPMGHNIKVAAPNLVPQRTMFDDHQRLSWCIADVRTRVVIIGPDGDGNPSLIGMYAQTRPVNGNPSTVANLDQDDTPPRDCSLPLYSYGNEGNMAALRDRLRELVPVELAQPGGGAHLFPLYSLCRSLNVQPPDQQGKNPLGHMVSRFEWPDTWTLPEDWTPDGSAQPIASTSNSSATPLLSAMGLLKLSKRDKARVQQAAHWTPVLVEGPRDEHVTRSIIISTT